MTEDLVVALPAIGDPEEAAISSLPAMVDAYASLLYRVAYSLLRDRGEAEDVVQNVFVRVLEQRGKIAAVRDMRVWLVRIAWNLALDHLRSRRSTPMDEQFAETLTDRSVPADEALEQSQHLHLALREIDRLPATERQALLLSAMHELSITDVAAVLGKSDSAVRALLFRARTRLRERMNSPTPKSTERGWLKPAARLLRKDSR